jgi:hypothetical protein
MTHVLSPVDETPDPAVLKRRAVHCYDRAMQSTVPAVSAALLELASALYFAAYAADMVAQRQLLEDKTPLQ